MRPTLHSPWLPQLETEVRRRLADESSGHDPLHAVRVRDLGAAIAKETGADTEIVTAAGLLHDIGHAAGREDHARRGASSAIDLLASCGFPERKIPGVIECIEQHHWLPNRAGDPRTPTLEYQTFADADRLDALGAIGIARVFAFGGSHQRPIFDPESAGEIGKYGYSSIHHFYDKLLRLPDDMYTEPGRRLAAERVVIMKEFLRSFYIEWEHKDLAQAIRQHRTSLGPLPERSVKIGDRIRRIVAAIFQPNPIN